MLANNGDPDQASDLDIHCLSMSHKMDDRIYGLNENSF